MTKKQLRAELEKAQKEIRVLQEDVERLERMKTYLTNKLSDPIEKAERDIFIALSNNLTKSLNQKDIVNMNPKEKGALNCMLEGYLELVSTKDIITYEKLKSYCCFT